MIPSVLSFPWNPCSQSFESTATKHSVDTSVFLCPDFIQQETRLLFISPDWSSCQERRHWLYRLSEPVPTVVISLCTWSSSHLVYTSVCKWEVWLMRWYRTQCAEKARFPCSQWPECNHSTFIVSQKSPLETASSPFFWGGGAQPVTEKRHQELLEMRLNRGWVAICHAPGPPEYTETLATSGLWRCLTSQPRFYDSILI